MWDSCYHMRSIICKFLVVMSCHAYITFQHILALSAKSRDFTIQEWTKSFLTSPPLMVQSCWPYLILSLTTKQIWPHLIWHFLRNLCTTQISPCDLIIPVADTRHVAETRIVADTYSHHLYFPQRPLISNKNHFIISVTSASPDI